MGSGSSISSPLTRRKSEGSLSGSTYLSYNYGNALNAAVRQGDSVSILDISDYLRYHFVGDRYKYNRTTEYDNKMLNVLPNTRMTVATDRQTAAATTLDTMA